MSELYSTTATYEKHPTHWYEDGNIEFRVENTVFRVFGGLVRRRSPLLGKMVDDPTAVIKGDGVPLLPLKDNLRDFTFLMDAIMPQTCSTPSLSEDRSWQDFVGVLKIACKYDVRDVADHAEQVLAEALPTIHHPDRNTQRYIDDPEAAVQIINASRECCTPQFLAPAFYALATQDWTNRPNDTNPLARLSDLDTMRVLQGRQRMQGLVMEMGMYEWMEQEEKRCGNDGCRGRWNDGVWPKEDNWRRWRELVLRPLEELKWRKEMPEHNPLCVSCREKFVEINIRMRDKVLYGLEWFFRLEAREVACD